MTPPRYVPPVSTEQPSRDALRRALRIARRELPADERVRRIARLLANLADLPWMREARVVAGYLGVGGEPELGPMLDPARHVLALPRTEHERMTLHRWAGETLVPGAFRIPEPPADLPLVSPDEVDLWLIPGLAFDRRGNRLGRGAGHYDRVLAGTRGRKVGIAWDFQVVEDIPAEAHDVPMDALVTDAGWFRVGPVDKP
jgi:5-formyltetrahydrofolate cyclo-ligase